MRIDYLLFGYRLAAVKECDRGRAATALLRHNISASVSSEGKITVPEYKLRKFKTAMSGIEYTLSQPLGLFSLGRLSQISIGAWLGILLAAVLLVVSSDFVFDVRIEEASGVSREEVAEALYQADFGVGKRWSKTDLDKIEGMVMLNSSDIGFISINRRGTCAYVSVSSKSEREESELGQKCNIVAKYDCVIDEITVKSGIAAVKAGDTVKAGDLLISGVIPLELGGGTLRAEGIIKGRISESIVTEVGRLDIQKSYLPERLCEVRINILDFSVNIFKSYRNLGGKYDIIKSEEVLLSSGGVRLPITVVKIYAEPYTESEVTYTDTELVAIAAQDHREKLDKILSECEILKISTHSEFTEQGYSTASDMLLITEVGVKRSIE